MKKYQKQAIKLAGRILKELNAPIYRVCPGCSKPTDELATTDGDKYGRVWHQDCFNRQHR